MPEINPPYRFDPLQNVVNVKWQANVVVAFGQQGPPVNIVRFIKPPATLGASQTIPTKTFVDSNGNTTPFSAIVSIDFRGFTRAADPDGNAKFFNSGGNVIDSITPISPTSKGKLIFSDDQGAVYVTTSGPGGGGRIRKYQITEGEITDTVIWTIGGVSLGVAVNMVDDEIVTTNLSSDFIETWDPIDGSLISDVDVSSGGLPDGVDEVTRSGRMFGFITPAFPTPQQVRCLSATGLTLWTTSMPFRSIPPSSLLVCHGESAVFTVAFHQETTVTISPPFTTTVSRVFRTLIGFDGQTGAIIYNAIWGDNQNTVVVQDIPPPTQISNTIQSFGNLNLRRNEYFPPRQIGF